MQRKEFTGYINVLATRAQMSNRMAPIQRLFVDTRLTSYDINELMKA